MVAIEIKSTKVRLVSEIILRDVKTKKQTQKFSLHLYSGRICKRLIYCDSKSLIEISYLDQNEETSIIKFSCSSVNEKFALSRIDTKLEALHPLYKKDIKKNSPQSNLSQKWNAYCSIFEDGSDMFPYVNWIKEFADSSKTRTDIVFNQNPLISILIPSFNTNITWLERAIISVKTQIYTNWQLCIADDASAQPAVSELIKKYAALDSRIKFTIRHENGHISAASNSALDLADGEWVALLDHDDELSVDALFWVALSINKNPESKLFYSDEDKIDDDGIKSEPYFKSEWNTDLFYSQNMFAHLGVFHTELVKEIGGFRIGFEGSQDYDLTLRCLEKIKPAQISHIPRVLYHWRIHKNSTSVDLRSKPYAITAGKQALDEHLIRTNANAKAEAVGAHYRVRYFLPKSLPLVSLIIPTRNCFDLLCRCIDSILNKTSYNPFEIIIIDNGSDDSKTLQLLEKLALNPLIRVLRDDGPFNYSALNNAAVKVARGEIIGLINNDIEVINADWLSEMVSHALRPGVAAVGARLWYSDDTLQHAGVVLGIHGIAGHVHRFLPRHDVGYCGRASLIQSFSAVTAACLVVRKSIYEELGGLNETELQVACNDVDFCLRAREAGYKNIWTPYAELYHHESASRGFDDTPEKQARSAKEVAYMKHRWGDALFNDPAYSPNLTLDSEDFGLAWPPRVPSLDEVLSAMERADQVSTVSSIPTIQ